MSVKTIKYFTKFNADYAKQVFFRLSSLSKNQFSVEILTKKTTMVMVEPLSLWFLNLFFHSKFTVYFIIYIYRYKATMHFGRLVSFMIECF